ncbi:MAG TPA: 50S ribosomal protein L11 methyltransferase [Vicinamibacteria bacterium]|nr:50S ribosomal protein L11 methyltransferase [Vicinamibacteria bacterium]
MRAYRVTVGATDEDPAVAALWGAGTAGIEVRPAPGGRVELLAYFTDDGPPLAPGLLPPNAAVEPAEVPDVDWVARFREGFRAFRAGRFTVAPPWDPSARRPSPDTLVVDPGRAFGTGTHETTRLCLTALETLSSRRPLGRTLDLGAGTGLLAVAAVRLGARAVCASDIDREANDASRHHARLNGVRLAVVRADGGRGFRPASFDLVLANLMALLLVDRAAEIRALVAPGGALVLSGLLVEDIPFLREAFGACGTGAVQVDGEWAALVYEGVP